LCTKDTASITEKSVQHSQWHYTDTAVFTRMQAVEQLTRSSSQHKLMFCWLQVL